MKLQTAVNEETVSALLRPWFRRGVSSNNFLTMEDYRREIQKDALLVGQWPGGLAVFRKRDGFFRMNYHLGPSPEAVGVLPDGPIVTEMVFRPGDDQAERAFAYWRAQGFSLCLTRLRLRRTETPPLSPGPWRARLAAPKELPQVLAFLESHFSPLTGCLPDLAALERDMALCVWDETGELAGALHGERGRGSAQIRHLAVAKSRQGTGAAQALMLGYWELCPAKNHLVWTGEDNAPARRFYEKCGYQPEGWTSRILCKGKEAQR